MQTELHYVSEEKPFSFLADDKKLTTLWDFLGELACEFFHRKRCPEVFEEEDVVGKLFSFDIDRKGTRKLSVNPKCELPYDKTLISKKVGTDIVNIVRQVKVSEGVTLRYDVCYSIGEGCWSIRDFNEAGYFEDMTDVASHEKWRESNRNLIKFGN